MFDTALIKLIVPTSWTNQQYIWPIPAAEIQVNANIKQNDGY